MLAFKYRMQRRKDIITKDSLKGFCRTYSLPWRKVSFMFRMQRRLFERTKSLHKRHELNLGGMLDGFLHNMICLTKGSLPPKEFLEYGELSPEDQYFNRLELFKIVGVLTK